MATRSCARCSRRRRAVGGRRLPEFMQHVVQISARRLQPARRLGDARLDHRIVAQQNRRAVGGRRLFVVGKLHEGFETGARQAERHAGKAHAVKRQQRNVAERIVAAAVGGQIAPSRIGLRHEQLVHLVGIAAGAAQPDHVPDVVERRLVLAEQHGAQHRAALLVEARLAVGLDHRAMAAEPRAMLAAAGKAPAAVDDIAAVDDDRFGARRRAPGDGAVGSGKNLARDFWVEIATPPACSPPAAPGTTRCWRRRWRWSRSPD